jgi:hypothetical protein
MAVLWTHGTKLKYCYLCWEVERPGELEPEDAELCVCLKHAKERVKIDGD